MKVKFLNCQIDISKKVFNPEAETEFWVEKIIKQLTKKKRATVINMLDIFAGSGCIGIALLKNIKNSRVDFADISSDVVKQIKINLRLNKISAGRYEVYESDLFEKIKKKGHVPRNAGAGPVLQNAGYDAIFANPPYVALNRISEVHKEVLEKDPHIALFGGREGLDIIKKFLPEAKKHLNPQGKIFMEFDPLQKEAIEKILKRLNLKYKLKKDQFKKYRWLKAS